MGLEREIHDFLVRKAGGANKVLGISGQQMSNLKAGRSGISTKKLKQVLIENGLDAEITLQYGNTSIKLKF